MRISFYKYQGTGNDFVMLDDRSASFPHQDLELVEKLCHRKFGIGSDGLILIRNKKGFDFEMVYFNADGTQSMCGNGARCAVAFANFLGIIENKANFMAIDGPHQAGIHDGVVDLSMSPVSGFENVGPDYFINTGSPHHVRYVEDVLNYPVLTEGSKIRFDKVYGPSGTNVNFVTPLDGNRIQVRTYERGVEDETLSCGTGVTACALLFGYQNALNEVEIQTEGGELKVSFSMNPDGGFSDIVLSGPAEQVFEGQIDL